MLIMFGLWVGDGSYDGDVGVRLSSGWQTKHIADAVAARFGATCVESSYRPDVNHGINSALLVMLMRAAGFTGDSHTKRVPGWVFGLSRRQIGLFLRGYFSADGAASGRVCVNSVNETLMRQTAVLLALCGVRAAVSKSKMVGTPGWNSCGWIWELTVLQDHIARFCESVGFVQPMKSEAAVALRLDRDGWRGDVPYCMVRERAVRVDSRSGDGGLISIAKVRRLKGDVIADKFAGSSICWQEVVESEPTDCADEFVYDLNVPGPENFFVGLTCCHNSWKKYSYGLKTEGVLKPPVLGVLHAPVETMLRSLPPGVDRPCLVCISDDQRSVFEALLGRPARTCHNGIDLEHYKPVEGVKRGSHALFLGRFSTIKGADLAVAACKEANCKLELVGDKDFTNEPQFYGQVAAQCDGIQVKMIGADHRGGTVFRYSGANFFIHPNQRFREPFGLAPVEAMACGLPVIAWDNGAMRETVRHGETGYLVKDYAGLVGAVKALSQPGAIDQAVRGRCRQHAAGFGVEQMAKRYATLCQEACQGGW
jgi:glycosyltransferase involved in cell wall biosynthesis